MMTSIVAYLVLSFIQPKIDSVPEITKYDDLQKACEAASHTIFPSTVWMEEAYDRSQCCEDTRIAQAFIDQCKTQPTTFDLKVCPQSKNNLTKMRCIPAPNFKLEEDK